MPEDVPRQILLELAFSLGGEPRLPRLLARTLPLVLRRTDAVHVGLVRTDGGPPVTELVVPRVMATRDEWPTLVDRAFRERPSDARRWVIRRADEHVHVFELVGVGVLLVGRRQPFDARFLAEFQRFVDVLTRACLAGIEQERRRVVESELHELQDRQRALLDNLPFAAWMTDEHGHLAVVNQPFVRLAGPGAAALLGRSVDAVLPAGLATGAARVTATALGGRPATEQLGVDPQEVATGSTMVAPDGRPRVYECHAAPITSRTERVRGATGQLREVTDRVAAERAAADRAAFQRLLVDLAVGFVNVPVEDLDAAIERALASTGRFVGVDRAYLFLYDLEAGTTSNTHEWCAPGVAPAIDQLQEVPVRTIAPWLAAHERGEVVHVPSVTALPASEVRAMLMAQDIETLLAMPMLHGGRCLGFVGLDVVGRRRDWTGDELALLRILAELFTNAEVRREREAATLAARRAAEVFERRLVLAFSATQDAIWDHDVETDRVHVARRWWELLGEPDAPADVTLDVVVERLHPDERDTVMRRYRSALAGDETTIEFESRLRHRDGYHVPLLWRARIVRDAAGRATRVVGSNRDLTERHRREAAARRQLELESTLAGVSARFVGLDVFDAAVEAALADVGRLLGASRAFVATVDGEGRLAGVAYEWSAPGARSRSDDGAWLELDTLPWVGPRLLAGETIHVPDAGALGAEAERERARLEALGVRSLVEVPLLVGGRLVGLLALEHLERTDLWTEADTTAVRAVAEIVAGALARARAEAELRSNEREHRTVVESLVEVVFRTDAVGRWSYLNPVWERITGIPVVEVLGTDAAACFHPDDRARLFPAAPEVDPAGAIERFEVRLLTAEDTVRWVEIFRQPEVDEQGQVVGTVGSFNDVTERRADEQALREAKVAAEQASAAKSRFISTVSHELRTPLTGVLGMLELLLGRPLDAAAAEHARTARSSARSLLTLVDDLLDVAKIEAGRLELTAGPVELRPLVEDVRSLMALTAAERDLEVHAEVAEDVPPAVVGDAVRLRQILVNLVGNALKFTETGRVGVRVLTTGAVRARRVPLRFEVCDTGIGIDPALLPSLFEPFTRADDSTTRRAGGTGLGLAIVQQLTELMDGRIEVDSRLGGGSCFGVEVTLPVAPGGGEASPAEVAGGALACLGGRRVLVVEDNEVNQVLARAYLEDLGCDVAVVDDGVAGVTTTLAGGVDLVLMDCFMPGLDGLDATRRIRAAHGPASATPIVALTADPSREHAAVCLAAGMDDVVTKPYGPRELATVLERWLGDDGSADPPSPSPSPGSNGAGRAAGPS